MAKQRKDQNVRHFQHFLQSPDARNFSVEEVMKMSDQEVFDLFVRMRWGTDGTQACPSCGVIAQHYFVRVRKQWRCRDVACGASFSVTSGTKFADHKLPLRKILLALVLYVTSVKGISASQLQRQLNTHYTTAFTLLHKLRETIIEHRDTRQVEGTVHVDGAHFGGRARKPRFKSKKSKTQLRARVGRTAFPQHPNRRIVMAIRQLSKFRGLGATRTIVEIVPAEDDAHCSKLGSTYIKPDSVVMTDESPAYTRYSWLNFNHKTVNHSREFSTPEGVSNNQAESFFTRTRRMIVGQIHRITPKYLFDYMSEAAWREDYRRATPKWMVEELLRMSLRTGQSQWWRGYCQGHHRLTEILFT